MLGWALEEISRRLSLILRIRTGDLDLVFSLHLRGRVQVCVRVREGKLDYLVGDVNGLRLDLGVGKGRELTE